MQNKKTQTLKLSDSRFSSASSDGRVICTLCPIKCKISEGKNGKCRVRQNINGQIYLVNYGMCVQTSLDLLKNRPIYLLGYDKRSLSLGLTGCNNTCPFCQNWMVSQNQTFSDSVYLSPEDVIKKAIEHKVDYISFTFTEPIVWIEYLLEISKLAKKNKIKICLKTAGYISEEFFDLIIDSVDTINLDIKPLEEEYLNKCGIYNQKIIWNFAKRIIEKKVHLEISHIVIVGVNDNQEKMKNFSDAVMQLGSDVAVHLLKHYPAWKSNYPTTSDKVVEYWKKYLISQGHKNIFAKDVG